MSVILDWLTFVEPVDSILIYSTISTFFLIILYHILLERFSPSISSLTIVLNLRWILAVVSFPISWPWIIIHCLLSAPLCHIRERYHHPSDQDPKAVGLSEWLYHEQIWEDPHVRTILKRSIWPYLCLMGSIIFLCTDTQTTFVQYNIVTLMALNLTLMLHHSFVIGKKYFKRQSSCLLSAGVVFPLMAVFGNIAACLVWTLAICRLLDILILVVLAVDEPFRGALTWDHVDQQRRILLRDRMIERERKLFRNGLVQLDKDRRELLLDALSNDEALSHEVVVDIICKYVNAMDVTCFECMNDGMVVAKIHKIEGDLAESYLREIMRESTGEVSIDYAAFRIEKV